jgi:hypothetical protein
MLLFLMFDCFFQYEPGTTGPEADCLLMTSVVAMVTGMIVMTGIRLSGRLGYGSL